MKRVVGALVVLGSVAMLSLSAGGVSADGWYRGRGPAYLLPPDRHRARLSIRYRSRHFGSPRRRSAGSHAPESLNPSTIRRQEPDAPPQRRPEPAPQRS
jgi:hypothetical protein